MSNSRRLPASRFIFVGPLVGETPGGRRWTAEEKRASGQQQLWQELMDDLKQAQPMWILDTTPNRGFGPSWAQYPMSSIPPLADWVGQHYVKAGQIEEFQLWHRLVFPR